MKHTRNNSCDMVHPKSIRQNIVRMDHASCSWRLIDTQDLHLEDKDMALHEWVNSQVLCFVNDKNFLAAETSKIKKKNRSDIAVDLNQATEGVTYNASCKEHLATKVVTYKASNKWQRWRQPLRANSEIMQLKNNCNARRVGEITIFQWEQRWTTWNWNWN